MFSKHLVLQTSPSSSPLMFILVLPIIFSCHQCSPRHLHPHYCHPHIHCYLLCFCNCHQCPSSFFSSSPPLKIDPKLNRTLLARDKDFFNRLLLLQRTDLLEVRRLSTIVLEMKTTIMAVRQNENDCVDRVWSSPGYRQKSLV